MYTQIKSSFRPTFQTTAPVTAQVSSHQSPAKAADQKVTFHLFEVAETPDSGAKTWGSHGATSSTKSLGGEIVQKRNTVQKKGMLQGWVHTRNWCTISNKSLQHYK